MSLSVVFLYLEGFFLLYFLLLYFGYLILNVLSIYAVWQYMQAHSISSMPQLYSGLEPPISLLAPAYNEEASIVDSVNALLQLNYSEFEIIIINDGSKDKTLERLKDAFDLVEFPEAYRRRIDTKEVKKLYVSRTHTLLRVLDKENGGKADSLNAGINVSRYPLFCAVDADSVLQPNSLEKIVQPFMDDPTTIAAGGTVRIVNGCTIEKGFLVKAALPRSFLARMQVTEYLRAFLFGRLGWSPLNALLIISGAFGLFHKETVVSVGGYLTDTIGEDMELIVRLHKVMRKQKRKYKITFVPDPICWTEAPEDLATLKNQRIRWQRGLSESLIKNIDLLFARNSGFVGWVAMPYMLFFEWAGPFIELTGFIMVVVGFASGYLSWEVSSIFFMVAIVFGMLLSSVAVLLEEMSFKIYPSFGYVFVLLFMALVENIGYRQLNSYWRIVAMYQWIRGRKASWGEMKRGGMRV